MPDRIPLARGRRDLGTEQQHATCSTTMQKQASKQACKRDETGICLGISNDGHSRLLTKSETLYAEAPRFTVIILYFCRSRAVQYSLAGGDGSDRCRRGERNRWRPACSFYVCLLRQAMHTDLFARKTGAPLLKMIDVFVPFPRSPQRSSQIIF